MRSNGALEPSGVHVQQTPEQEADGLGEQVRGRVTEQLYAIRDAQAAGPS